MTDAILMTGKRGTGKSLNAVKMMQQYMQEGRIVATNLDLFLDRLMPPGSRALSYRLPDVPTAELLNHPDFPIGNPNPIQENRNGLLVLDECAGYLNAREWKDGGRTALIHWLAQSRKHGWDLLLIAQGPSMIDKQIRTELCDVHGICRETSKIGIPFVTLFFRSVFGIKVMMPKLHVVSYYYGFGANAVRSYVDIFRTSDVQNGYNTLQKISAEFGQLGMSSNLSAWHVRGRYMSRWDMYKKIIITALMFGLLVGLTAGYYFGPKVREKLYPVAAVSEIKTDASVFVSGVVSDDSGPLVILTDGRSERAAKFKADLSGSYYLVGSTWYKERK